MIPTEKISCGHISDSRDSYLLGQEDPSFGRVLVAQPDALAYGANPTNIDLKITKTTMYNSNENMRSVISL